MIVAHSCVLIDLIEQDTRWCDWSQAALDEWGRRGSVLINPVIYAELSPEFSDPSTLDHVSAVLEIANSIGIKLVLIPAGEFMMGSGEPAEEIVKTLCDTIWLRNTSPMSTRSIACASRERFTSESMK